MTVGVSGQARLIVSSMSSDFYVFDFDGKYADHFRLPPYQGISPAILNSDRLVAYAFKARGENSRDNKILKIYDFKGQVQHEFGEPFVLETALRTWEANFLHITVDDKDNIFVAFTSQNRIEKYSGTGQLVLSIDRALPYKIEHRYEQTTMDIGGASGSHRSASLHSRHPGDRHRRPGPDLSAGFPKGNSSRSTAEGFHYAGLPGFRSVRRKRDSAVESTASSRAGPL